MTTLAGYVAARERRNGARHRVLPVSNQLRAVADLLQNPEHVRFNEQTMMRVQRHIPHVLDESDLPMWPQIADALRAFLRAEGDYLLPDSSLSAEQRRHLTPDR